MVLLQVSLDHTCMSANSCSSTSYAWLFFMLFLAFTLVIDTVVQHKSLTRETTGWR